MCCGSRSGGEAGGRLRGFGSGVNLIFGFFVRRFQRADVAFRSGMARIMPPRPSKAMVAFVPRAIRTARVGWSVRADSVIRQPDCCSGGGWVWI